MSATIHLLTPAAAVAVPAALAPAAAVLLQSRRRSRTLAVLGLRPPRLARRLGVAAAATAASALLIAAATQPVIRRAQPRSVRTDAELFVVLDTSRSMAARASRTSPTREERAKRFAVAFRSALPEIRSGVGSFTDRVLPHLLPSSDLATFASTVSQAVGINRPPPSEHLAVATSYEMLWQLPSAGAFSPHVRRRLLVLLTDGESQAYSPGHVSQSLRSAHTSLLLVRFWRDDERVFVRGRAAGYVPSPSSTRPLDALAARSVGGRVFGSRDARAAAGAARGFFGSGPVRRIAGRRESLPLAPWLTLAALLPLGLVLGRRGGGSISRKRFQQPVALRSKACARRGPRSTTWPAWRVSRPPPSRAH